MLNKTKYIAIGDSITWTMSNSTSADINYYVTGTNQGDYLYPKIFAQSLSNAGLPIEYINKAIGNTDSNKAANQNYSWLTSYPADIVSICLGTNDALNTVATSQATFLANINRLITGFKNINPNVLILLCTPPTMVGTNRPTLSSVLSWIESLNNPSTNIGLCRFDTLWTSGQLGTYTGSDQVHPNKAGHALMGPALYSAYQSLI